MIVSLQNKFQMKVRIKIELIFEKIYSQFICEYKQNKSFHQSQKLYRKLTCLSKWIIKFYRI